MSYNISSLSQNHKISFAHNVQLKGIHVQGTCIKIMQILSHIDRKVKKKGSRLKWGL
jgi:hypothetical protein